jgi:hypothetical protein
MYVHVASLKCRTVHSINKANTYIKSVAKVPYIQDETIDYA